MLRRDWNIQIISTKEELEEADCLLHLERLAYYDTAQKKLDYFMEMVYQIHYEKYEAGFIPRLDRTIINII